MAQCCDHGSFGGHDVTILVDPPHGLLALFVRDAQRFEVEKLPRLVVFEMQPALPGPCRRRAKRSVAVEIQQRAAGIGNGHHRPTSPINGCAIRSRCSNPVSYGMNPLRSG